MDNTQKEFLIDTFFNVKDIFHTHAGAKKIAEKLIDKGECLIAGSGRIWYGGVGNFIFLEFPSEAVGCIKLKFDVKAFMSKDNQYFMGYYENHLDNLFGKITQLTTEHDSIKEII